MYYSECLQCHTATKGKRYCSGCEKRNPKATRKPFRIFDGEGRTLPDGRHLYVLLTCYDGETFDYVVNEDGLSLWECFEFLTKKRSPAIPVWFSFGYDVNKILEDIPLRGEEESREALWRNAETTYKGWHIRYIPRKFFDIWNNFGHWRYASSDVFSFFQMSFLKACEEWKIDASIIEEGKENRGNFNEWDIDEILYYAKEEAKLAWQLCNRLRSALYAVNLRPARWHGPGAIASAWLQREKMQEHYPGELSKDFEIAISHAYFGGRIDVATIGEVELYKYDLASAYPAALTHCISLRNVEWKHEVNPTQYDEHGLYHVTWDMAKGLKHYPFPWRQKDGKVLFPPSGEGWYWGIELRAATNAYKGIHGINVSEGYVPSGAKRFPFREPITRDYTARAELKAKGDAANIAIKLALNSIYGKLCQHRAPARKNKKKPTWQNFIWAGYITAYTRAKILDAMAEVGIENVVQIATDGIGLLKPLNTAYAKPAPLGEWEIEGKASANGLCRSLILGPGVYAVIGGDVYKSRGMPSKINYGYVLREWGCDTQENTDGVNDTKATHPNFIGMGRAIHQKKPCGVFIDEVRQFQPPIFMGTSKRKPAVPDFMRERNTRWRTFDLIPRSRPSTAPMLSAAYEYHDEFDPDVLEE